MYWQIALVCYFKSKFNFLLGFLSILFHERIGWAEKSMKISFHMSQRSISRRMKNERKKKKIIWKNSTVYGSNAWITIDNPLRLINPKTLSSSISKFSFQTFIYIFGFFFSNSFCLDGYNKEKKEKNLCYSAIQFSFKCVIFCYFFFFYFSFKFSRCFRSCREKHKEITWKCDNRWLISKRKKKFLLFLFCLFFSLLVI